MTKDENKASYSEIVPRYLPYSSGELMSFNFQLQYAILKGGNALIHRSTVDGFAHIIMVEGIWSGTYLLNGRSHIIQCCENAIHPVRKNCLFEWKNVSEDIVAILLFIPQVMLDELITIKYGYDVGKLDSGLISKNNQRLSLVVSRLYDLSVQQRFLNTLRLQILLMETLLYQIEGFHFEKEQPEFGNNKNYYEKVHQVK